MNLVELAQRIKDQRLKKRLTLEDFASRVDLTVSALSKIENFRVTPSLPALGRIAKGLDTTVSELVAGLDEKQPLFAIVKKNEGKRVERDRPSSKIQYSDLAYKRRNKVMAPFLLDVPPGIARKEALPHEGEEFLMVTQGRVRLEYGDNVYELSTGDSSYFDATVKHRLVNPGRQTARVLCVFTDQNGH